MQPYSEMLGINVLSDLDAKTLPVQLKPVTEWGKNTILKRVESPKSTISELKKIQLPLLALRHSSSNDAVSQIREELQTIHPHCSIVDESCKSEFQDERIKESVQQILWDPKSHFATLNTKSKIISGLINWKTLVVPFFSIIMPLLAVIVPFFLLRFVHGSESVSIDSYVTHVKQTLINQISIPNFLRSKHSNDTLGKITESLVLLFTVGTFFMGLWNQIQSAMHLRSIAKDLKHRGIAMNTVLCSCRKIIDVLETLPHKKALSAYIEEGKRALEPLQNFPSGLAGFGTVWNTPILFTPLISWIGLIDAYIAIVSQEGICFPIFSENERLKIVEMRHPNLNTSENQKCKPVQNTAEFCSEKHHALLTGPNRGGKSTFCKALGLNILYAQTWGIAWAKSMKFTPFTAIETALSLHDTLGKLSLFETEIEFAKQVLQKVKSEKNVFVMMDEIFHSTNAQDGVAASRVFLQQLYATNVCSLISTHYKQLVEEFTEKALAWQMIANERPDGFLDYTYKKADGISEKSSVMEILKERGLLAA